jgi:hypothetical protein
VRPINNVGVHVRHLCGQQVQYAMFYTRMQGGNVEKERIGQGLVIEEAQHNISNRGRVVNKLNLKTRVFERCLDKTLFCKSCMHTYKYTNALCMRILSACTYRLGAPVLVSHEGVVDRVLVDALLCS